MQQTENISQSDIVVLERFLQLLSNLTIRERIMRSLDAELGHPRVSSWLFASAWQEVDATEGYNVLDKAFNNAPAFQVLVDLAFVTRCIPEEFQPSVALTERCLDGYFKRQRRRVSKTAQALAKAALNAG